MTTILGINAGLIATLLIVVWLMSLRRRDVSIVDIAWGLGFVLVAWNTFAGTNTASPGGGLVTAIAAAPPSARLLLAATTLWGLRLSVYLAWRNHGRPEDKRYAAMRERRGARFWWQSLFVVFGLQGIVMWVISLPIQVGISRAVPGWSVLHGLGLILWSVGIAFEAIGDWQLARFKADPASAGRVLDRGLWRFTRHPNYFGDFCVWWGLYAIAAVHGAATRTVVSPLLMSLFLLRVSGVTLLEQSLRAEKPDYEAYVQRTSAFLPWPPRERT